ncbi:MAG: ABC transporter substrate-binding protein [Oscillospiraceae bacterium]|jgi:iron complex transport system substrate-binding protein|nr:ABC transporter substrate-binding protein [Oscillospiraceae bacterium]
MRKIFTLLLAAALVVTLFAGCKKTTAEPSASPSAPVSEEPTAPETPADTKISLTDPLGVTVTLDKPAEKVVALTASDAEIVYALGAGSTLVGRGEYCDYPAEIFEVQVVNSGNDTNVEQIIALKPDLVLMATMAQSAEQSAQLLAAGIQVYTSDSKTIDETYNVIGQIGTLLGKDAEAKAVVDGMKADFAELSKNKLEGTVYFEVSPLEWGLWTAGSGTFMQEVADLIGLTNIFADVDGYAEVSEEQVLARNPDYILTVGMYFGEGLKPDEEIYSRANWQKIAAVKNKGIANIDDNSLSRPGPRLAQGAKALYDFIKNAANAAQ